MKPKDRKVFESLTTAQARASWLLSQTITAKPDVDPKTLGLVWKVYAADVMLPGSYTGSEQQAVQSAIDWLTARAAA